MGWQEKINERAKHVWEHTTVGWPPDSLADPEQTVRLDLRLPVLGQRELYGRVLRVTEGAFLTGWEPALHFETQWRCGRRGLETNGLDLTIPFSIVQQVARVKELPPRDGQVDASKLQRKEAVRFEREFRAGRLTVHNSQVVVSIPEKGRGSITRLRALPHVDSLNYGDVVRLQRPFLSVAWDEWRMVLVSYETGSKGVVYQVWEECWSVSFGIRPECAVTPEDIASGRFIASLVGKTKVR